MTSSSAGSATPGGGGDATSSAGARARRAYLSVGLKLTIPLVLLVAGVAFMTYFGVVQMARKSLLESKVAAATMVVNLFSASVSPAVVFSDELEMRRSVDDLARNEAVTDVEVWSAKGAAPDEPPLVAFHRVDQTQLGRPASLAARVERDERYLDVYQPIVDAENVVTAIARVRFSLERERQALTALAREILYASTLVAVLLAASILLLLARVVVVPLGRLERAAVQLEKGDRGQTIEESRLVFDDEVGRLSTAFKRMAEAVEDREEKLSDRNSELKLILDNVSQGFFTARPDGTLQGERSAIVDVWLGALPVNASFGDVIERLDPKARAFAEMGWAQLGEGFLPIDVCLGQLPHAMRRGEQHFDLAYHPVLRGEELERMVIVLSDVTADVERRRVEEEQREFASLVDRLVRDRTGFLDFWNETTALVARLVSERADPNLKRDLHTLKGNSRFFGVWRLSALCHQLEDALEEREGLELDGDERARLQAEWDGIRGRIEALTQGSSAFLELSEEDYRRLAAAVRARASYETLTQLVNELRYEPTRRRLERARDIVESTCRKLGKPSPVIHLRHDDLRLPPGRWAQFWSTLTHVLVNAADHGLETEQERVSIGKPGPGAMWLSTTVVDDRFIVSVRDDGRGIDWQRVKSLAEKRGIPHQTRADLETALLSEGLSTKTAVADVSGRGVGLSAVRTAVEQMGGKIEVVSGAGAGTEWRFCFRASLIHEEGPTPTRVAAAAGPA